jgi:hypothetical protein
MHINNVYRGTFKHFIAKKYCRNWINLMIAKATKKIMPKGTLPAREQTLGVRNP